MTMHDTGHDALLHFEHAGEGAHVVLIHAGIADSRMWAPQWAAWEGRFALTRLDLRGFGRSGRQTGSFSHAADVLAVLDATRIDRAALVGASFGGRVALDLAAAHPERVTGLVVAVPPLPGIHDYRVRLMRHPLAKRAVGMECMELGVVERRPIPLNRRPGSAEAAARSKSWRTGSKSPAGPSSAISVPSPRLGCR